MIALDDGKSWIKVESEVHGLGKYFPENVQCLPGETIDVERLVFCAGLTGKSQQLPHDLRPALRSAQDHPNAAGTFRWTFSVFVQQLLRVAEDDTEDIVEVMGDASSEGADGFHL